MTYDMSEAGNCREDLECLFLTVGAGILGLCGELSDGIKGDERADDALEGDFVCWSAFSVLKKLSIALVSSSVTGDLLATHCRIEYVLSYMSFTVASVLLSARWIVMAAVRQ